MAWYHIALLVLAVWFLLGVAAVAAMVRLAIRAEPGDMCDFDTDPLTVCPCCSSTDVVIDPDGAFLCSTCRCVTVVIEVDLSGWHRAHVELRRRLDDLNEKETGPC